MIMNYKHSTGEKAILWNRSKLTNWYLRPSGEKFQDLILFCWPFSMSKLMIRCNDHLNAFKVRAFDGRPYRCQSAAILQFKSFFQWIALIKNRSSNVRLCIDLLGSYGSLNRYRSIPQMKSRKDAITFYVARHILYQLFFISRIRMCVYLSAVSSNVHWWCWFSVRWVFCHGWLYW